MFKFAAFAVLLSAYFIPSECSAIDPVTELNNYLCNAVESDRLGNNILAARQLNSSPELGEELKRETKELAGLVSVLQANVDDTICVAEELKKLQTTIETVVRHDEESFRDRLRANRRLNRMLAIHADQVWEKCLRKFEAKFKGTPEFLSERYGSLTKLKRFYSYLGRLSRGMGLSYSLDEFLGATNIKSAISFIFKGYSGHVLRKGLEEMYCLATSVEEKPCGLKFNEMTGSDESLTLDEVKTIVDVTFFEPCKSLRANETLMAELEPVIILGKTILTKNLKHKSEYRYATLDWAGISIACEWLLGTQVDSFANLFGTRPSSAKNDKIDPLFKLNSYLVDNLKSNWDLDKNIEAIQNLNSPTELDSNSKPGDSVTGHLVQLISELKLLDDDDFCGGQNLENLRATTEAVVGYEKDSFKIPFSRRRLNFILIRYTKKAISKCLESKFEPQFEALDSKFEPQFKALSGKFELLEELDAICVKSLHTFEMKHWPVSKVARLFGALNLPDEINTSPFSFKRKLKGILYRMDQARYEETDDLTGKRKSRTIGEQLEKSLFKMCNLVQANVQVKGILKPVVDLSVAIHETRIRPEFESGRKTLIWAPRLLACKWFLGKGLETFVDLLSKKTLWLAF